METEEHFTMVNIEFQEKDYETILSWANTVLIGEFLKSKGINEDSCFLFLDALNSAKRSEGIRSILLITREIHEKNKPPKIFGDHLRLILNERFKDSKRVSCSCFSGPSVKGLFDFSRLGSG